jgi:hypothetical protein
MTFYCVYSGGSWQWVTSKPSWPASTTGYFCCGDTNCTGYDSTTHTKMVCDCPSGCTLSVRKDYTCQPKGTV